MKVCKAPTVRTPYQNVIFITLWLLFFIPASTALAQTPQQPLRAESANSIDVDLIQLPGTSPELELRQNGQIIDYIDFPKSKEFIRFSFPQGYSDFDIRVFEQVETGLKNSILTTYKTDRVAGVEAFDELWGGKASSPIKGTEFYLITPEGQRMILRNLNVDGTHEGTLHDYILRFTVNGKTYLQDPKIRNKN